MHIYINGEELDLAANSKASFHSKRIRFSDVLSDDYSTDIQLPATAKNIRLLGADSLLDLVDLGHRVNCQIVTGACNMDGYLTTSKATRETITATLYSGRIPVAILDRKLHELSADNDLVTNWDGDAFTTSQSARFGLWKYAQGLAYVKGGLLAGILTAPTAPKPSIKVSQLLSNISAFTGCTLPTWDTPEVLTATGNKTTKAVKQQSVSTYHFGSSVYLIKHASSSYNEETGVFSMVAEFTADMRVTIYGDIVERGSGASYGVYYTHNGQTYQLAQSTASEHSVSTSFDVSAGDKFVYWGDIQKHVMGFHFTYSNISNFVGEDEAEISYCESTQIGSHSYRYNYFPIISNIADMSVRQLLTSLAWYKGKTIKRVGDVVTFEDSTGEAAIDGRVTEIRSGVSSLGKTLEVTDANGNVVLSHSIAEHDELPATKSLHKSSLVRTTANTEGVSTIKEYSLTGDKEEMKGAPISLLGGAGYLIPAPWYRTLFIAPSRAQEVTIETYDDVQDVEFVTMYQRRFAIIEVDTDTNTQKSTIKAIRL